MGYPIGLILLTSVSAIRESSRKEDATRCMQQDDAANEALEFSTGGPPKSKCGLEVAGECKRRPGFCEPSNSVKRRTLVKGRGWCCFCPPKSIYNPGTHECVCAGGPANGLGRVLPNRETRRCPESMEESDPVRYKNATPALSQVKMIQDYCYGRRTLEEFMPGSDTKNFAVRMGFDMNTAVAIETLKFEEFSATFSLSEADSGMQLTISNLVFHVVLTNTQVVAGNRFIQVDRATIQARAVGTESVAQLAKFGVPGNITVTLIENIQLGNILVGNRKVPLTDTLMKLFKDTIKGKVLGSLVTTICSNIAFNMRGAALDSILAAALQARDPFPLNIEVKLCQANDRNLKGTCLQLKIDAGDTATLLEKGDIAARQVAVNAETGLVNPTFALGIESVLEVDFVSIIRSFADDATVLNIASGDQKAGTEKTPEDGKKIISLCNERKALLSIDPATGAAIKNASKFFSQAAGVWLGFDVDWAWDNLGLVWESFWKKENVDIPVKTGQARVEFEQMIFHKWQELNRSVIGIMMPDRSTTPPAYYIGGLRDIEINIGGTLTSKVDAGSGTLTFEGDLTMSGVKIMGLVYDVLNTKGTEPNWETAWGVHNWDVLLNDVVVFVIIEINADDKVFACADVPMDKLVLKTKSVVTDTLVKTAQSLSESWLKSFVGKTLESTLVSLLESAVASAPNALQEGSIGLTVKKGQGRRHEATISVNSSSDWEALGTLQASSAAIPPAPAATHDELECVPEDSDSAQELEQLRADVEKDAVVQFGRGWTDLQAHMGPPPRGTAEKLSYEPNEWLDVGLYKSLDKFIPAMSLRGEFNRDGASGTGALVSLHDTKVWADVDGWLRSALNDHGAWIYGHFLASHVDQVMVEGVGSSHAVLSCGALYLVSEPNRLWKNGESVTAAWKGFEGTDGVFDLVEGKLVDLQTDCNPGPGSQGRMFEGHAPGNKKFRMCIPKSEMTTAIDWENRRLHEMHNRMKGDYKSFTDWSPVSWPFKSEPFDWEPNQNVAAVMRECTFFLDACSKYMGCMGVSTKPCTYLSSRDVAARRTGTFIYKKWSVGLP